MRSTQRDGWTAASGRTRILAIDPGTRIAGYAVLDFTPGRDGTIVDAGVLRLHATGSLAHRVRQLFDDVVALVEEHAPTHLALEGLFSHVSHARTAIQMAHGRGAVLLAAELRGLPIAELAPAEVKKALTGSGRASKAQMQRAVMTQCALAVAPEPPDVADAIGIALCAGRRLGSAG